MVISESNSSNYQTKISNEHVSIGADISTEKGGNGDFRPHELLCSSLAACLNITARMVMDEKKISYDKVIVKVDLDKRTEGQTTFEYQIDIVGDITERRRTGQKGCGTLPSEKDIIK